MGANAVTVVTLTVSVDQHCGTSFAFFDLLCGCLIMFSLALLRTVGSIVLNTMIGLHCDSISGHSVSALCQHYIDCGMQTTDFTDWQLCKAAY